MAGMILRWHFAMSWHVYVLATSMSWCQDWLDLASAHLLPLKFEAFMMAL
jgi:hypothetical protein